MIKLKAFKGLLYVTFLLVCISFVSAISLDELLAGYDWGFSKGDVNVSGYSSYGLDTDSNSLYDFVVVNLSVQAKVGSYVFDCELSNGVNSGTSEVVKALTAGANSVLVNFSAQELDSGVYNFSVRVFSNDNLVLELYENYSLTIDSSYGQYPVSIVNINDSVLSSDADSLFEELDFNLTLNVTSAAQYELVGYLSDSANKTVRSSKITDLSIGVSTVSLPFFSKDLRKAHLNDNLTLRLVEIKNTSQDFTKRYSQTYNLNKDMGSFDPEGVLVTDYFADKGLDLNSNSYFDQVQLDTTIYSNESKTVVVEGAITDYYGSFVDEFNKTTSLVAGNNTVQFFINGTKVYNTQINGPYKIAYVNVVEGNTTLDTLSNAYTLQNISYYTDCEPPIRADLTLSVSDVKIVDLGNNLSTVEVTVYNVGDRTAFVAQVNVFNNLSDELGEQTLYFIQKNGNKTIVFPRLNLTDTDTLSIFLDFNDLVEEKNESNNILKVNSSLGLSISANQTLGNAPLLISFSSVVSKGNQPFTYSWDFNNDGTIDSTQASPTNNYTAQGNYTASLTVTDVVGLSQTKTVNMQVNPAPDIIPPVTVTNLNEYSVANDSISWNWTNPTDSDFSKVMVYLDGVFQANTSNNYYVASGLQANTSYTLSTVTVDTNGNINTSWVNDSAKTLENLGDIIPPGPVENFAFIGKDDSSIYWTWTNPSDPDFAYAVVYLNGQWKTNTTSRDYLAMGLISGTPYTISVMTVDTSGNINTDAVNDTRVTNGVAPTTPPASVTGLGETQVTNESIRWDWVNPVDSDFAYVVVFVDGQWKINTSNNYYLAIGLQPDTIYIISTQTVDAVGNINDSWVNDSARTNTNSVDTTPPATVTNLGETIITNTSIRWDWVNPSDSDFSHAILFLGAVNIANTSNSYFVVNSLQSDTFYTLSVQTVDTVGNVNASSVSDSARTDANVVDTIPPLGVSGLSNIAVGNDWIYWSWVNPSDSDFAYSVVYLNNSWMVNTSAQFFNATGLSVGATYEIEINAVDTSGNINLTQQKDSATTLVPSDTTPPGQISNLRETATTNSSIRWDWVNPVDSDFSKVVLSIAGVNFANTSSNYYVVSGLSANTSYTISVMTVDTSGNLNGVAVQNTTRTSANVVDTIPPLGVSGLSNIAVGNDWIYWSWVNPADSDFSHSVVYVNSSWMVNTSNAYYNATGLISGLIYEIEINTVDNKGNINLTQQKDSATTLVPSDTTPPGPITGLGETAVTSSSIRWDWVNPVDSDFGHAIVYLDGVWVANVSSGHYSASGFVPSTVHSLSVRTVDVNGNVNAVWVSDSATTSADITPPASVTGIGETQVTNESIRWDWVNPVDVDFSEVILFVGGINFANTSSNYYVVTNLQPGTSYTISVQTVDSNNNVNTNAVQDSATTSSNVVDTSPPGGVTSLADQVVGNDWIYWTWTNPGDSDFAYSVVYLNNSWMVNTSAQFFNATGLSVGATYEIEINTVDNKGNINLTQQKDSATTLVPSDTTPPGQISNLRETATTNSSIRWDWVNPVDSDFSKAIVSFEGVNFANTSSNYYVVTNLQPGTSYTISVQTVDLNNNININSVQDSAITQANVVVSDPIYADAGYPLFGAVNDLIQFNASYSYCAAGIVSYSWNFGDGSTGSGVLATHAFSTPGNYTSTLIVTSAGGNSSSDSVKVVITVLPSYNYNSYASFSKTNSNVDVLVREYGEDFVNGFRKKIDYSKIEAVLKVTGDNLITPDQVRVYTNNALTCKPVGNGYFKCVVYDSGYNNEIVNTYSHTVDVYSDAGVLIDSVPAYIVIDDKIPTINLVSYNNLTSDGLITFNYDFTDYAYLIVAGSGIGKLELYKDNISSNNLLKTDKVDSLTNSATGVITYDSGVVEGSNGQFVFCIGIYDKLGQKKDLCSLNVVVDKKKPGVVANSFKIFKNGDEITEAYDGDKINVSVDLTDDLSGINVSTVTADLSSVSSAYNNRPADSCAKNGNVWTCSWDDLALQLSATKTINTSFSFSDNIGNSNSGTASKQIVLGNRNPTLTVSDITINEGQTVTINPVVSDPDGDSLTISYSGWMSSSSYKTDYNDAASHTVTVVVNDGRGGIVSKDISITVNNVLVPDLVFDTVNVWDGKNPVVVEFKIKNIGEVKADNIRWSIETTNAAPISDGSGFSLDVGKLMTFYSFIKYTKTGTFPLTIKVDPNNSLIELNEANNNYTKTIMVS